MRVILILIVLLLALAAGGFFYLVSQADTAAPAPHRAEVEVDVRLSN